MDLAFFMPHSLEELLLAIIKTSINVKVRISKIGEQTMITINEKLDTQC